MRTTLAWIGSACLLLASQGQAAEWNVDAAQSRLEFTATFEKAPISGVFRTFDVKTRFDPRMPAGGSLDVSIDVTSADMNVPDVNKEIGGRDWFDYVVFPRADFHSTDLRATGKGFVARGMLTLKGASHPLDVPFSWKPAGDGVVMEGAFTVKRGAYGIGRGEWEKSDVIGPDVEVKFKVKWKQGR